MLNGARILDDAPLSLAEKREIEDDTAAQIEAHALRSSPLHLLLVLCLLPSTFDEAFPRTYVGFFIAISVATIVRVASLVGSRRWRPRLSPTTRRALFFGPWLLSCFIFSVFSTTVVALHPAHWESLVVCSAAGLGGLSAVIYFAPYGRATLLYALMMASPPGITMFIALRGEGPGLVMGFMWVVFVALVVPSLSRLNRDHWSGVVGRRLLEKRADLLALESQRKSDFLAHVSHDLRTPLNGIIGMSTLLSDQATDVETRENALAVGRAGADMLVLVNELLDDARATAGHLVVDQRPFEVQSLFQDIEILFRTEAAHQNTAIVIEIDDDVPPRLIGDGPRLRQILRNLVSNAMRATHDGTITVRAAMHDDQKRLVMTIADSGVGFSDERRATLFNRFSSAEGPRSNSTGLGLHVSRSIARQMGGDLVAHSEGPMQGATFTLTVDTETPKHPTSSPQRVLLADDDELSLRICRAILEKLGYVVVLAHDGLSAIAQSRASNFDFIVIDCLMPGATGPDVARDIRTFSDVPIIAVTANAESLGRECAAAGVNHVISKPLDFEALAHAIGSVLQHRSHRVAPTTA